MSETLFQHTAKTTITMLAFALVGTAMLAYVFEITRTPIEKSEAEARLALFAQILPNKTYDNALLKDVVQIAPNDLLGNKLASNAHVAKLNGQAVGVILEAIAHDGYSGDIKLLIAIRADGSVSGVRVLAHKETPGLGDYIDIAKDQWIQQFNDESLSPKNAQADDTQKEWQVKKDGGKFDYMAGATITPRAVVKAVYKALQYFEQNKTKLFANADKETV